MAVLADYFAPWIFGSTMREHQLVSDMLQEMTDVLGCANRSCNPHDHRWHLGCMLPRVPAMILRGQAIKPRWPERAQKILSVVDPSTQRLLLK